MAEVVDVDLAFEPPTPEEEAKVSCSGGGLRGEVRDGECERGMGKEGSADARKDGPREGERGNEGAPWLETRNSHVVALAGAAEEQN